MKRKTDRVKEIDEEVKALRRSINSQIAGEKTLLTERQSLMGGMERCTGRGPKSKGRTFENEIVASILAAFPQLTTNDVWARSMGDPGVDIILSEAALKILPLAIECKRVGRVESLDMVGALSQARANCREYRYPVVVYREDRHKPQALMFLGDLPELANQPRPPEPLASITVSVKWADLLRILGGYKE